MPKKEINDYVFYKFVCNDENIKSCYVGSTSNFKARKNQHKNGCLNDLAMLSLNSIIDSVLFISYERDEFNIKFC